MAAFAGNEISPQAPRRSIGSRASKATPTMMTRDRQQALQGDHFAQEHPGAEGADDVAQRQHRVGDGHVGARQADDPHHQRDGVAGQAGQDRQLGGDLDAGVEPVVRA